MSHGEVKEVGKHAELISRKELYHDLVNAQLFQDTGDAAAAEGVEEEHDDESVEAIIDIDSPTKRQHRSTSRQYSRLYSRHMSTMSASTDALSHHSDSHHDHVDYQPPRRRLLAKAENERERLKVIICFYTF